MRAVASALCLILVLLPATRGTAAGGQAITFYDPDANHAAILQITRWFNIYLDGANAGVEFQPVGRRNVFEKLLSEGKTPFAIVTSEYLKQGGKGLEPLLVPSSNGDVYYRKILYDKGVDDAGQLSGKTIAATFAGENERVAADEILRLLKKGGINVEGALVTFVSKDIDALMALYFGQAQAALVTPNSVEMLERRYPAAVAAMRKVFETQPILRPPLCAVKGATADQTEKMMATFMEMAADKNGRNAMLTLGFDAWVPYKPGMLK